MKAIVWTQYGAADGLEYREVEKPTPTPTQVLIRVRASSVTAGDCELRALKLPYHLGLPLRMWFGFRKPRAIILGQEMAGEIEAVGKEVTRFREGEQVFGCTGLGFGAYAEYLCLPEDAALAIKPTNMTYEEAAAVPTGGLEALHFLGQANIRKGQDVLIVGAGGGIGTPAVQLAKYFGGRVTTVDSTEKLEMLRSIGADAVIDYTREDFTGRGETYDVIFEVPGKSSLSGSLRSLKPNGCLLLANPRLSQMFEARWSSRTGSKRVIYGAGSQRVKDLIFLKELIEAGKLKTVIDRRYPLEQTADAHRYVDQGHKKGNVILNV